jgi:glycine cleavage system H lipoate-binding protein
MPELGSAFKKVNPLGVIESVETVADLYSPLNRKIVDTSAAPRITSNTSMRTPT